MTQAKLKRKDLLYPELSYKVVGILIDVFKELGAGYVEKVYQKAIAVALEKAGIGFQREVYIPVTYQDVRITKVFADFIIENKVVLEIKTDRYVPKKHIEQVIGYLNAFNMQLGIIGNFTRDSVKFMRILNLQ